MSKLENFYGLICAPGGGEVQRCLAAARQESRGPIADALRGQPLRIEQRCTPEQIDVGDVPGFTYHPITGKKLSEYRVKCVHPVTGCLQITTIVGMGWGSTSYKQIQLPRIGDGRNHTLTELRAGLPHWQFNAFTGEKLT